MRLPRLFGRAATIDLPVGHNNSPHQGTEVLDVQPQGRNDAVHDPWNDFEQLYWREE